MPQVKLPCSETWEDLDESIHVFENIEEGMQGEDIVTFICMFCKKKHKLIVYK